ncbi:MAG: MBL fold metallo-hydrolase [Patescibacteria group bacterium]|jgi:L-ascorbate metabolism protein UlaG (beta-lactamase superfamily)
MQIVWHGLSCFEVNAKLGSVEATVITDPYGESAGVKIPRSMKANMVVVSHDQDIANNLSAVSDEEEGSVPFLVNHAGEYEVRGIFATGIRVPKKDGTEHTIYRLYVENVKIAFLGALDRALTADEIAALGDIDVLLVPVGGHSVLTSDEAQDMIKEIEPRLLIPYYYQIPGCKFELDGIEGFCKELSCTHVEDGKLKITKSGLSEEETQTMVLPPV